MQAKKTHGRLALDLALRKAAGGPASSPLTRVLRSEEIKPEYSIWEMDLMFSIQPHQQVGRFIPSMESRVKVDLMIFNQDPKEFARWDFSSKYTDVIVQNHLTS
jgi:hypothetical protein